MHLQVISQLPHTFTKRLTQLLAAGFIAEIVWAAALLLLDPLHSVAPGSLISVFTIMFHHAFQVPLSALVEFPMKSLVSPDTPVPLHPGWKRGMFIVECWLYHLSLAFSVCSLVRCARPPCVLNC